MKQNHTIIQYLDESNAEAKIGLKSMALKSIGWTFQLSGIMPGSWRSPEGEWTTGIMLPTLDHDLAAKVRETLFDTEEDIFMQHLRDYVGNPIIRHDYTTEWKLISASAAQQIVATLIAKGILK